MYEMKSEQKRVKCVILRKRTQKRHKTEREGRYSMRKISKKLCLSMLICMLCILMVPQTLQAAAKKPNASIRSYSVGAGTSGYVTGTGKKLKLQAKTTIKKNSFKGTMRLRIRVLNSKKKYVYQKYWTIKKSGTGTVNWNGKPSSGNAAKLSTKSYVKPGTYKVEFAIRYKASGTKKWKTLQTKTKTLKIVKEGPKKETAEKPVTTPATNPETVPEKEQTQAATVFSGAKFTGNKEIDYIAEEMIRAAGVKAGMSQDERVKAIYHYMTVYFKHVHYSKKKQYTVYYDVENADVKQKIDAYYAETQTNYKAGKLTYGKVSKNILLL